MEMTDNDRATDGFDIERIGNSGGSNCRVLTHRDCDPAVCEVSNKINDIHSAEIELVVTGGKAAIWTSVAIVPVLLFMHCWAFVHGKVFDIPAGFWGVALVPSSLMYAVIGWLKIRRSLPVLKDKP